MTGKTPSMSTTQNNQQALKEHKVIPDVLSDNVKSSYSLTLKWPNTTLESPGQELDREETQPQPLVYLNPAPSEPLSNLVLIMTDPDLMMNDDTYFGQVRHWLVTNVSTTSEGYLAIPEKANVSPYVGPAPLPNYISPRPHRYVFILAQASGSVDVSPEDLRELQKPYAAAIAGKQQETQDLKDRWGFNAQKFIENKGLEVKAVTFMRVAGTLKSAVANMAMTGQALANKAIGK